MIYCESYSDLSLTWSQMVVSLHNTIFDFLRQDLVKVGSARDCHGIQVWGNVCTNLQYVFILFTHQLDTSTRIPSCDSYYETSMGSRIVIKMLASSHKIDCISVQLLKYFFFHINYNPFSLRQLIKWFRQFNRRCLFPC